MSVVGVSSGTAGIFALARDALRERQRRRRLDAVDDRQRRRIPALLFRNPGARSGKELRRRLPQPRIERARPAQLAALAHHAVCKLRARRRQVAFHHLVDEAQFERLLGGDGIPAHHHAQCCFHADQARQALRAGGARQYAQLHLGQPELGAGDGAAEMAGQRELQAPAEGEAVDRRHHGFGHRIHVVHEHRQGGQADWCGLAELRDVRTAGERPAAAQQQECAHRGVVLALLDGIEDALQHALADAECVDRRIVECDDAQVALDAVGDDFAHDWITINVFRPGSGRGRTLRGERHSSRVSRLASDARSEGEEKRQTTSPFAAPTRPSPGARGKKR
jgi:hypothetical protein